jgi:hypothetical protein
MLKQKILTPRSDEAMIFIGNFKKRSYISIAKAKNFVSFPFTFVLESPERLMAISS